jgi:hypothetical protein
MRDLLKTCCTKIMYVENEFYIGDLGLIGIAISTFVNQYTLILSHAHMHGELISLLQNNIKNDFDLIPKNGHF